MESAPPSYEAATLTDVLTVIAPYIYPHDLCAATLVSRRFHRTIVPRLWGSPALHIGLEHDGIDDRLARFQRTLVTARPQVRSLVHTLYIPSSEALYFDERPADWLVKLLQWLPNLQALNVHGLLYFDHAALQSLRSRVETSDPALSSLPAEAAESTKSSLLQQGRPIATFENNLKLLDASGCKNVTGSSLSCALPLFSKLLHLDLSGCTAARHASVLASLAKLWHLKVLRLRAVGLDDNACLILAEAISRRVASLDLASNQLTDKSVVTLIQSCIGNTPNYDYVSETNVLRYEDLALYRSASMEASVRRSLTTGFINRLAIEDLGDQGITHLYLGDNRLSTESLHRLIAHHALNVLDMGKAFTVPSPATSQVRAVTRPQDNLVSLRMPMSALMLPVDDHIFHMAEFTRLQRLVLANFPDRSSSDKLVGALISLIEQCALAEQQSQRSILDDYTAPPGRAHLKFSLRVITLEIVSYVHAPGSPAPVLVKGGDKSFTGDQDGNSLWDAADSDFSFFNDDKASAWQSEAPVTAHSRGQNKAAPPPVDNLALLAAFRAQRRLAHEKDVRSRGAGSMTTGFWSGTIVIDRNSQHE